MTKLTAIKAFQRKIDTYCELRLSTTFSGKEAEALKAYKRRLVERWCASPRTAGRAEWDVVGFGWTGSKKRAEKLSVILRSHRRNSWQKSQRLYHLCFNPSG